MSGFWWRPSELRTGRFLQPAFVTNYIREETVNVSEIATQTVQTTKTGGTTQTRVQSAMEELLHSSDHFVVDVAVRGRSGSIVVEVYLDGDNGIGIRDLAAYSRELGFVLEAEDVIRGKYHLNVSSPGEERSLLLARQYPRHEGRMLEVELGEGESTETLEGKHAGMDEDGRLILETAKETRKIDISSISRARIKLPW